MSDYMAMENGVDNSSEPTENVDENVQFAAPEETGAMMRRDTFVGTPLYVSPEMLKESVSLPASDLWALGCIIFKMHTGRNAFNGFNEHQLFQQILAGQLNLKNAKTPLS